MSERPLVSLFMVLKDGMPWVKEALNSVLEQTYPNIELIVQDGESGDGSLDYLRNFESYENISVVSKKDSGIGEACQWALERCRGDVVGSIDSDNILHAQSVEQAVQHFATNPKTAVLYGDQEMINEKGEVTSLFRPGPFDLSKVLTCEMVPPFGSAFFFPSRCKGRLKFDSEMPCNSDYDLWLKLSDLSIDYLGVILSQSRVCKESMTCQKESYDKMCEAKIDSARRFLKGRISDSSVLERMVGSVSAGIYVWAAELFYFGFTGESNEEVEAGMEYFLLRAEQADPQSRRAWTLRRTLADNKENALREEERLQIRSTVNFKMHHLKRGIKSLALGTPFPD